MAVVAGSAAQIGALNALIARDGTTAPVLVIGAGKVGQAAARALKQKALVVHALDRDEKALATLAPDVDAVYAGDAADRETIERAGIGRAASVLLTTNDDAMNIYLAVLLPQAQSRPADREPHHARAQRRGHSPRRRRFRAQLHVARDRQHHVARQRRRHCDAGRRGQAVRGPRAALFGGAAAFEDRHRFTDRV